MKRILTFFSSPIVGGSLSFIGTLELLFSIPSCYLNYKIPIWIIALVLGVLILMNYFYKKIRIIFFIKNYTSDSFGGSRVYSWQWVKTDHFTNVYGYMPVYINVQTATKLDPKVKVYDCSHCINNQDLLQEYIMIGLYDKVENTRQTNLFMTQLHTLEAHYFKQRN